MSNTPFMQFYPGDYLGKTMDLTTEQHGAYLLILMTMWQHDAKLPNDPAKLARIARMTPAKFKAVWSEISRFFAVQGDSITNARLLKEHEKAKKKSEARAVAGKAGGRAKSLKDKSAAYGNCHADAMASSSDTRVKKEDANASLSLAADHQPIDEVAEAVLTYRAAAERQGWPIPQQLDQTRRRAISARIKAAGGPEGWRIAIEKAAASPFLGAARPFSGFGIDWIAKAANFKKIMEGNYDDRQSPQQNRHTAADDRFGRIADAAVRNRAPSRPDFGFG